MTGNDNRTERLFWLQNGLQVNIYATATVIAGGLESLTFPPDEIRSHLWLERKASGTSVENAQKHRQRGNYTIKRHILEELLKQCSRWKDMKVLVSWRPPSYREHIRWPNVMSL